MTKKDEEEQKIVDDHDPPRWRIIRQMELTRNGPQMIVFELGAPGGSVWRDTTITVEDYSEDEVRKRAEIFLKEHDGG